MILSPLPAPPVGFAARSRSADGVELPRWANGGSEAKRPATVHRKAVTRMARASAWAVRGPGYCLRPQASRDRT